MRNVVSGPLAARLRANRLRAGLALGGALVLASCLHGGPAHVAPTGALVPSEGGDGPRARAAFAVVFAGPRGTVHDRRQPAVTVLFNRAMRALEQPDDANVPAVRLTTDDGRAVAGAWRWIGTHGLLFTPSSPLPGATRFAVVVPAGTRSADGEGLRANYTFEFATERPRVTRSWPSDGANDLREGGALLLQFNQAMDPAAVEKAVKLVVRTRPGDAGNAVALKASRPTAEEVQPKSPPPAGKPGKGGKPGAPAAADGAASPGEDAAASSEERDPAWYVRLTPQAKLPLDASFELTIDPSLKSAEGALSMKEALHASFRTYGPIRLADYRCAKVSLGRCQAHRDVTVVLNNEVHPDELAAHLRAPGLPKAAAPARSESQAKRAPKPAREHPLGVDPEMGRRYHVVLTAGMRDVFGQTLAKDIAFDVDTEAPFVARSGKPFDPSKQTAPSAEASGAGEPASQGDQATSGESGDGSDDGARGASDDEAKNDPRPRRARLDYDLTLGIRGHVVEALAKQGPARHKIPIGAVNVPTYGAVAAKMREEEALSWLAGAMRGSGPGGAGWRWEWFSPNAKENTRAVRQIDLDQLLGGPGSRGAALVAVTVPGDAANPSRSELLTVTDLAVSAKLSRYGTLVWITHLSTGAPVPDATVAVRKPGARSGGELFSGTTDARGLVAIPSEKFDPVKGSSFDHDAVILARAGDDWTYQRVERAAASFRSGVDVDLAQRGEWAGLLFTDRGVYRPGEAVKLAGIFRRVDAAGMKSPEGQEVRVAVNDGEGEKVFDGRAKLDAFGSFAIDAFLPKTAHLGDGRVVAQVGRRDGEGFDQSILLAAYKASEFKVAVEPEKKEYVRGDVAAFDVRAEYLFGAPLGDAGVHDAASRAPSAFTPKGSEGFTTTDEASTLDWPETNPRAEELRAEDGELDEDGRMRKEVKLDLPRQRGPEVVTFEAEVEDLTRQTVAKRATVLVHPAAFYLGIQRPAQRFVAVGAEVKPQIAAFDPKGAHVAGVAAKVELVQRVWTSVTEDVAADAPVRRSRVRDEVVAACDVTTTAQLAGCSLRVDKPGYYILRARAKDGRGNQSAASTSFYSVDDRADQRATTVAWSDPDVRGMKLEADKPTYKAGETAKILVRNPFREAQALVTVERAGVVWQSVVALKGPMPVVEVPVKAEWFPNAYVAVHAVRGRVQAPPANGADLGAPDFRIGVTELKIDPDTHRLDVDVKTAKKEYRPGEELDADLTVSGRDGRPTKAEVTFYAVDEGVLMLTGYKTPDPLPAFAEDRKLATFALDSREHLAKILALKNGEKVARLGWEFFEQGDDKGRDGGGGGEAQAGARADFKTTAYFEAGRVTTAEGKARFHFKLPDNLTTFRLMAVVSSNDERFGMGEASVTTNRKLMARPAMPRVVRAGDTFEAGVVVTSKDLPASAVDVSLKASGVVAQGPATKRVTVPRGGSVEVRFPVKATAPGDATFQFGVSAASGEAARESDRVLVKRKIELPVSVQTVAAYGETDRASAVQLGDLSKVRRDQGGLEVHLASTALVGLETSFDRTLEYPYGCTEQITSKTLPLLAMPEMARAFHARLPAKLEDAVDEGIGDLSKRQNGDGGFGFWEGEDESLPWLSAYAMLALETAARRGYFVPKEARDRGITYLRRSLTEGQIDRDDDGDDDDSKKDDGDDAGADDALATLPPEARPLSPEQKRSIAWASAAFVADVLATLEQADPGTMNKLFDARARQPLFAQALLLHGMARGHMPRAELDVLAKEIEQRLRVDASLAFAADDDPAYEALLDSPARTTALALRALLAADPKHPLAARLARGLLSQRTDGAWRSTQENVWALMALDDYRKAQETDVPDFDAKAFLGDDRVAELGFHGRSSADEKIFLGADRVASQGKAALTFQKEGTGRLFYSAELTYATAELPTKPLDHGFFVQKLVRPVRPAELAEAEKVLPKASQPAATAGDLVLVDLLLESAEPREQVVIDDPMPSGLEPIDFNLETAARSQRVSDADEREGIRGPSKDASKAMLGYGVAFRSASGMHREHHDDRVLTFLPKVEPGIYHFRYLARATVPGRYVVPPTKVLGMYQPEANGRTGASWFDVRPSPKK